jgi:Phospholipase_D-nuclease N-terminal
MRFFISYRHRADDDRGLADYLSRGLKQGAHEVFIDTALQVGTDWAAEIGRRIDCLGTDATASVWDADTGEPRWSTETLGHRLAVFTGLRQLATFLRGQAGSVLGGLTFVALLLAVDFVVIREVVSGSLSASQKAAWSMVVFCVPIAGTLCWLFVRPGRVAPAPTRAGGSRS